MKQKLTKLGGMVLLVVLITSLLAVFAGGGLITANGVANPVRTLPAKVMPGQTFSATVNFTAPCGNFNAIGLTDLCPAGWNISFNKTWCSPEADFGVTITAENLTYLWYGYGGIYGSGTPFSAVYHVTVPGGATPGTYNFTDGILRYYCGEEGEYDEGIGGANQVEVALPKIAGETRAVNCTMLDGVNVTAYQGAVAIASTLSDGTGNYELAVPALGDYNVTASKAGFRSLTQPISVTELITYTLDFVADYGLIPNAPDLPYVLACINKWVAGTEPCKLNLPKVLAVINAWVFPI
jgi:hypothetical protein